MFRAADAQGAIQEINALGQEILQDWAQRQVKVVADETARVENERYKKTALLVQQSWQNSGRGNPPSGQARPAAASFFRARGDCMPSRCNGTSLISRRMATAAPGCSETPRVWMEEQKARFKSGRNAEVLAALKAHAEPESQAEKPVRSALCYLSNRPGQLIALNFGLTVLRAFESVHFSTYP
ncbi:MAG: hypothetical protein LBR88_10815 [Zoogloeaceae bacterium]|nr:hypothetical protein [Zoogloeaceae bacterium]